MYSDILYSSTYFCDQVTAVYSCSRLSHVVLQSRKLNVHISNLMSYICWLDVCPKCITRMAVHFFCYSNMVDEWEANCTWCHLNIGQLHSKVLFVIDLLYQILFIHLDNTQLQHEIQCAQPWSDIWIFCLSFIKRLHRTSKASPYLQRVAFSDHGPAGKARGPRPVSAVSRTSDKKRIDIKFMTRDGEEEEDGPKPAKKRPESAPVYKTKRYFGMNG